MDSDKVQFLKDKAITILIYVVVFCFIAAFPMTWYVVAVYQGHEREQAALLSGEYYTGASTRDSNIYPFFIKPFSNLYSYGNRVTQITISNESWVKAYKRSLREELPGKTFDHSRYINTIVPLTRFDYLRSLSIRIPAVDGHLKGLRELDDLSHISIESDSISEKDIEELKQYQPEHAFSMTLKQAMLERLVKAEALGHYHELYLTVEVDALTVIDVELINALGNLKSLGLKVTKLSDSDVQIMKDLRKLKILYYSGDWENDSLVNTDQFHLLEDVEMMFLRHVRFTDRAIESITRMKKLAKLNLFFSNLNDDHLRMLSKASTLNALMLSSTLLTDESVETLKSMNNLQVLFCASSKMTEKGQEAIHAYSDKLLERYKENK